MPSPATQVDDVQYDVKEDVENAVQEDVENDLEDDVKDDVEGGMRSLAGSGTGCSSLTAQDTLCQHRLLLCRITSAEFIKPEQNAADLIKPQQNAAK